jgi:hypothetical protein
MPDTPSPSKALSTEVVDRLIKAGLLRADKRDTLIANIASGTMKGADWKLEIDLAQVKTKAAKK